MLLASLPQEILLHVVAYLEIHELERLAQTFNCQLTPICLELLSGWLQFTRNQRKMLRLFDGDDMPTDRSGGFEGTDKLGGFAGTYEMFANLLPGLSPTLQFTPDTNRRVFEYMSNSGGFRWLTEGRPCFQATSGDTHLSDWGDRFSVAVAEDMLVAEESMKRLGLTPPPGYISFMTSSALQTQFKSAVAWRGDFVFRPQLHRIVSGRRVPVLHGGTETIDGYLSHFYVKVRPLSRWSFYLYMHRNGGCCVISSLTDLAAKQHSYRRSVKNVQDVSKSENRAALWEQAQEQLTSTEKDLGVALWNLDADWGRMVSSWEGVDAQPNLIASTFEKYLMLEYFENLAMIVSRGELISGLPDQLRDYMLYIMQKAC